MRSSLLGLRPQKIIIRSTNWIGDAIMTTPAVRTIRDNFPSAEITMLALPWVADVFAASPHVDKIMVYDRPARHRGMGGMMRLIGELRAAHFDMAILLQNAFEAAFLAFMAAIPVRAGYRRDGRSLLLTHGIPLSPERRALHHVFYYQNLLADLGLTPSADELVLAHGERERAFAVRTKEAHHAPCHIGLNPGAAFGPAKCWPAERYGELASELHKRCGAHFFVFGGAADAATGEIICGYGRGFITNLAGRTTLGEAMALIGACDAFVTNDSGLMHVAAAARTPLVALFGSTNAVATGPFSKQAVVVQKELPCRPCMRKQCSLDFSCMLGIGVDEVADEVLRLPAAPWRSAVARG